jgi:hypothetical protein
MRILATGVRVLPQRDWEERERLIYRSLHGATVRIDARATLVLPRLSGRTLADLLDDPNPGESIRKRAIELAVVSLARFHRLGLTHGDAMAENVMVDLEDGVAHWFDFETIHQSGRPTVWRRADDVRALLSACLLRTDPARQAETLDLILNTYADESVTPHLEASFRSVVHRPLAFHLGQAALSLQHFREISRLLRARLGEQAAPRH